MLKIKQKYKNYFQAKDISKKHMQCNVKTKLTKKIKHTKRTKKGHSLLNKITKAPSSCLFKYPPFPLFTSKINHGAKKIFYNPNR